jgi:hypothetical protein
MDKILEELAAAVTLLQEKHRFDFGPQGNIDRLALIHLSKNVKELEVNVVAALGRLTDAIKAK